jgi:hypothetical protein
MSDTTDILVAKYSQEYNAYLVKLASDNIKSGIIYEPRVLFDEINAAPSPVQQFSGSNIFKNGERFPYVLTHMTLFCGLLGADGATVIDESMIQRIGAQYRFHDQWYMNPQFTAAPNWITQPTALPPGVSQSTSSWKFEKPVLLGSRDTLKVQVGLVLPPEDGVVPVTVTVTGIGVSSMRPYFFSGTIGCSESRMVDIPTQAFLNDGAEPVLITDMIVNTSGEVGSDNPVGDTRNVRVQITQMGNGTGNRWFVGPTAPGPLGVCGAGLGVYSGRCIVHQFPSELIWEPGEGIDIAVQLLDQQLDTPGVLPVLAVALCGYITVQ